MSEWDLVGRVALGFGLTFVVGFERELRGGPAGDRTYALIGTAGGRDRRRRASPTTPATPSPA